MDSIHKWLPIFFFFNILQAFKLQPNQPRLRAKILLNYHLKSKVSWANFNTYIFFNQMVSHDVMAARAVGIPRDTCQTCECMRSVGSHRGNTPIGHLGYLQRARAYLRTRSLKFSEAGRFVVYSFTISRVKSSASQQLAQTGRAGLLRGKS